MFDIQAFVWTVLLKHTPNSQKDTDTVEAQETQKC